MPLLQSGASNSLFSIFKMELLRQKSQIVFMMNYLLQACILLFNRQIHSQTVLFDGCLHPTIKGTFLP